MPTEASPSQPYPLADRAPDRTPDFQGPEDVVRAYLAGMASVCGVRALDVARRAVTPRTSNPHKVMDRIATATARLALAAGIMGSSNAMAGGINSASQSGMNALMLSYLMGGGMNGGSTAMPVGAFTGGPSTNAFMNYGS